MIWEFSKYTRANFNIKYEIDIKKILNNLGAQVYSHDMKQRPSQELDK